MKARRPVVAANWKMFKTPQESHAYVDDLRFKVLNIEQVDIILCVPYTSLFHIHSLLDDRQAELGAQNMYWKDEGAFTGEISPRMLKSSGARWVVLGHSERRHVFQETDKEIVEKVRSALKHGLRPILCIGETMGEREKGETVTILTRQLEPVLELLEEEDLDKMVIAYEPVWAIGTGVNATPDQIETAHESIRELIRGAFRSMADEVRVLYGGSVNPGNASDLIAVDGVDGFLVGGASLQVDTFVDIIKAVENHQIGEG